MLLLLLLLLLLRFLRSLYCLVHPVYSVVDTNTAICTE
jgi:hypothetical protein